VIDIATDGRPRLFRVQKPKGVGCSVDLFAQVAKSHDHVPDFLPMVRVAIIVGYVTIAFYLKRPFDDTHQDQI
jgi:hypothetical protein